MAGLQDAQYRDPRLVALYEALNGTDHDYRFYEVQLGSTPLHVFDLGCALACWRAAWPASVTRSPPSILPPA
jgi:hypothetical protein